VPSIRAGRLIVRRAGGDPVADDRYLGVSQERGAVARHPQADDPRGPFELLHQIAAACVAGNDTNGSWIVRACHAHQLGERRPSLEIQSGGRAAAHVGVARRADRIKDLRLDLRQGRGRVHGRGRCHRTAPARAGDDREQEGTERPGKACRYDRSVHGPSPIQLRLC